MRDFANFACNLKIYGARKSHAHLSAVADPPEKPVADIQQIISNIGNRLETKI